MSGFVNVFGQLAPAGRRCAHRFFRIVLVQVGHGVRASELGSDAIAQHHAKA